MKKKILLVLLFLNILPIFATAQNVVSADTTTVKIDNSQQIKILKNEIASLKDDIKSIYEKSLKAEDVRALFEKDKKEERNSPIWMITLVVSLYVGIFIFLSISLGSIQNYPPAIGEILSKKLKTMASYCILGIAIFFITILFSNKIVWFCLNVIGNFLIILIVVRQSIDYLNVNNLIVELYRSNPKGLKDAIEFYINKEDFATAYNLLNSIKNISIGSLKYNKEKFEVLKNSLSEMLILFANENLVCKKIIYRDFFRTYMEILFKTQDLKIIEKGINGFWSLSAIFMKQKGKYYQKLYENCSENFVFIIEKAIKDINVSKEEKFIDSLIDRFITYASVMIKYNKTDSLRYMFEEMIKVVRSKEFTEDRFLILKTKFLKMLKCRSEEVNDILMFFLHRVIRNRMGKKVSSVLIDELVERQYEFVFEQCNDRKHWNKYLNEYREIDNQKEVKEILNNKYSLK